ncbi:MAG: carboxypeptidase-like regulatory domain-containing protein, partial [Flavobacteriaceae bacterium]
MRNFKNLLFVALFFVTATVLGQTKITGTVVDDTNQPLPGASVVVKGTTNGTSTDFDGKFTLNAASNSGTIVVSFIGFSSKEVAFSSKGNVGTIQLAEDSSTLDEIVVTATSFAIDRKTPVAVSTIKASDIELKLGSQEFPEILKSTPGVYATKSGGGFGDGRLNLRGFNSENVAVMINGVPVNDMENGRVYWSNWAGLSDVTSAMQ